MNAAAASIPPWVFAVLLGLLLLGWRQSRPRVVRPNTLAIIAIAMLAYSLHGIVATFGALPVALVAWGVGMVAAIGPGRPLLAPRGLTREAGGVRLPGSWLPMALLMGIFAGKFVLGVTLATAPEALHAPAFIAAASLTFGLLSGAFASRAIAVQRFADRAGAESGVTAAG